MIQTQHKNVNSLYKTFKSLDSDILRWKFLITNANTINESDDITIYLDNDDTYVSFGEEVVISFDNFIGDKTGVFALLKVVGLEAEGV
ncbi:hypothetical protein VPH5P1C_0254 [Vibrio phage 5P1c]|nr:hypothetical protein VP495E541_P0260 [Vibrio phage 495E54-1]